MPCEFNTTAPVIGDNLTTLLSKLIQAVGASWGCGENEWTLLAKLLTHFGGNPSPGDTIMRLWEKIRRQLGNENCNCGDAEWNAIKSVLDIVSPGSFAAGDARYNLIWKILEALQTPIPVFVAVASAAVGSLATPTASPTVNYPTVQAGDIMLAIFSTNTPHDASGVPPTGWTKLDEIDEVGNDSSGSTFWKRASGSEPASEVWTNIFSTTEVGISVVVAYRNCIATGSPIEASSAVFGASANRQDTDPVTTTLPNCMLVGIITADPTVIAQAFDWDAGINERIDTQAASVAALITVGDKLKVTAGSVTLGGNWSTSGDSACKFLYGLKPAL